MAELDPHDLAAGLHRLWATRDDALRQSYDRSLPFADGLFDRWERAARLGFGEGASIYDSAMVYGPVSVGANTWIGPGVVAHFANLKVTR